MEASSVHGEAQRLASPDERLQATLRRSADECKERLAEGGFAVALSGGGHRATLFTLGAVLALIDRGLGGRIMQIASVSGGSVTNVFLAQRVKLERAEYKALDDHARQLVRTITKKGVVNRVWTTTILATPLLIGVIVATGLRLVGTWRWIAVVAGVLTVFGALLLSGHVIDWLFERHYLRATKRRTASQRANRAQFSTLTGSQIDHVLCMTDLVTGLPVYATPSNGGMIYRRRSALRRTQDDNYDFQTFRYCGRIAPLLRASAGFPGIPPLRTRVPEDARFRQDRKLPHLAFLADGGIWNNLGSQVLREDQFIGLYSSWEDGVLRPHLVDLQGLPLLIVNGSAPLPITGAARFHIPGAALAASILRMSLVQNFNTVEARLDSMRHMFDRQQTEGRRPSAAHPANLIVDLRPLEELELLYFRGAWTEDLIRQSDPAVSEWRVSAASRVADARNRDSQDPENDEWCDDVLGNDDPPLGSYPIPGLANLTDWKGLGASSAWKAFRQRERVDDPNPALVTHRTTLGRIKHPTARYIMARGYANAYMASLFLKPLEHGELDRLQELAARLDDIASSGGGKGRGQPGNAASTRRMLRKRVSAGG